MFSQQFWQFDKLIKSRLDLNGDIRLNKYIMTGVILPYKDCKKGIAVLIAFLFEQVVHSD